MEAQPTIQTQTPNPKYLTRKTFPEWLKGSIVFTIFGILFMVVSILSSSLTFFVLSLFPGFFVTSHISECFNLDFYSQTYWFTCSASTNQDNLKFFVIIMISMIVYFAIGALYGKLNGYLSAKLAKYKVLPRAHE